MAWDDAFTQRDYDHYMGYDAEPEPPEPEEPAAVTVVIGIETLLDLLSDDDECPF